MALLAPDLRKHWGSYLQYDKEGNMMLDDLDHPSFKDTPSPFAQTLSEEQIKQYQKPDNRQLSHGWYINYHLGGEQLAVDRYFRVGMSSGPCGETEEEGKKGAEEKTICASQKKKKKK